MRLLQCPSCGLVVSKTALSRSGNGADWFGGGFILDRSPWVRLFESWNNRRTWKRISSAQAKGGGRLLEVGIGSGSLLYLMRSKGFDVLGCDLSADLCAHAHDELSLPVHHGPIHSLPPDARFDIIVMNHVLEHVDDPLAFLKEAQARLSTSGLLYLAVPNLGCWEACLPGWMSYEPYHKLYFTPASLREALIKSSLRIGTLMTHESFSGWPLALLRTALRAHRWNSEQRESQRRSRSVSRLEHVYRLTMLFFGGISWPLRRLQSLLGHGDEIIVLARRLT